MRALPVLLSALLIAGCGEAEREAAARPAPAWVEHSVSERGATVSLPPGWEMAAGSLTPVLADPQEVFSAANFPLRHHPAECEHMPSALEDLGESGVLVTVQEREAGTGGDGYPARPERFAPHPQPSRVECAPDRGEAHWIPFSDGDRRFYGLVAFGPAASQEARDNGFEVLSRAVYRANSGPN